MNLWRRFRQLHGPNAELNEEIRSHLAMAVQDRVERGETRAQAEQNARKELGNELLIKEVTRDIWGWTALERFGKDLQYALRQMKLSPSRSEEHTSELQSPCNLVCRLLLEKKKQ